MEQRLQEILNEQFGKTLDTADSRQVYQALMLFTKEKMAALPKTTGDRKLYYVSAEFLIGKQLSNNLIVTAHGNHALDKAAGTEGSLRSRLLLFILFKATLHIRTPWHQGEQLLGMLAEVHGWQIGQANVQIRFWR